eukprot:c10150_g1_i1 orf=628-1707(+)
MNEAHNSTLASLPSMQADAGELIPGLPDFIVLDCVLPRVPWYTRAVLRAASKAWKHALREPHIYSELSRCARGMKSHKLVMVHQLSEEATFECFMKMSTKRRMPRPHAISILEEGTQRVAWRIDAAHKRHQLDDIWAWRKLPPIPTFAPLRVLHDCGIACVNGKIFVMGGWDPRTDTVSPDVYMLDITAGLWEWEAKSPMNFPRAFFHCTSSADKVYVVGGTSVSHVEDPDPEVYNVDTNTWELLPRVNKSRSFHFNGLALIKGGNLVLTYGFCTTDRGELVGFRSAYDPAVGVWSDYECDEDNNDDVKEGITSKFDNGGDGIVSKFDDGRDPVVTEFGVRARGGMRNTSGVIMSVMMV